MELNLAELKVNPTLEVITGPMFSGKSMELNRRLTNIDYYNHYQEIIGLLQNIINYIIIRPCFDSRDLEIRNLPYADKNHVRSKDYSIYHSLSLFPPSRESIHNLEIYDLIVLDEAQFYSSSVIEEVRELIKAGKSFYISGLDKDFRGNPFSEFMSWAMASCDNITKLHAICSVCGRPSTMEKLITKDGSPIPESSNLVIEDDNHIYVPVCRKHFD